MKSELQSVSPLVFSLRLLLSDPSSPRSHDVSPPQVWLGSLSLSKEESQPRQQWVTGEGGRGGPEVVGHRTRRDEDSGQQEKVRGAE